jgi:hypothetical protein
LLQQLSRNSKAVEGLQSDIIAVKEYASDLQAILGSKVIEEEVQKEEEYLMALLSVLNVVCKVSLISLIDFTDGCCITDIICACSAFIVMIATDGGLVSIYTDPNVVIVDNISNNIDKVTKNRQQNLLEILQQRQMFQDQIKQMRVKINFILY